MSGTGSAKPGYWVAGWILLHSGVFKSLERDAILIDLISMYVKSVAVLAQVLCIVSFGPLADSREQLLICLTWAACCS